MGAQARCTSNGRLAWRSFAGCVTKTHNTSNPGKNISRAGVRKRAVTADSRKFMLHEFIAINRDEIIRRCRAKVAKRSVPPPTEAEIDHGVPVFLDQLTDALRLGLATTPEIGRSALQHGHDLLLQGFTVSQVVHDYGDVCQAVTDLAVEVNAPISADDFRTLNRCLDEAIAGAVTEYGREQNQSILDGESARGTERLGFLAHELRNLTNSAIFAFEVLKTGNVGVAGSTGMVLHRSLMGLRALIGRSLAETRFTEASQKREPFLVSGFIEELAATATLEANARGIRLTVLPVEAGGDNRGRPTSPRRGGGKLTAERIQVHAAPHHRDSAGGRQRRASADRDPGRMRRPPARECERAVPPVRAARHRSNRRGSWPRLQPMGGRGEPRPDLRTQPA